MIPLGDLMMHARRMGLSRVVLTAELRPPSGEEWTCIAGRPSRESSVGIAYGATAEDAFRRLLVDLEGRKGRAAP